MPIKGITSAFHLEDDFSLEVFLLLDLLPSGEVNGVVISRCPPRGLDEKVFVRCGDLDVHGFSLLCCVYFTCG
jgi:hypothetical protein